MGKNKTPQASGSTRARTTISFKASDGNTYKVAAQHFAEGAWGKLYNCTGPSDASAPTTKLVAKRLQSKYGFWHKKLHGYKADDAIALYKTKDSTIEREIAILKVMGQFKATHYAPKAVGDIDYLYIITPHLGRPVLRYKGPKNNRFLRKLDRQDLAWWSALFTKNPEHAFYALLTLFNSTYRLHSAGYSHNDLHGSNMLVNPKTYDISIIDFGKARHHNIASGNYNLAQIKDFQLMLKFITVLQQKFNKIAHKKGGKWQQAIKHINSLINSYQIYSKKACRQKTTFPIMPPILVALCFAKKDFIARLKNPATTVVAQQEIYKRLKRYCDLAPELQQVLTEQIQAFITRITAHKNIVTVEQGVKIKLAPELAQLQQQLKTDTVCLAAPTKRGEFCKIKAINESTAADIFKAIQVISAIKPRAVFKLNANLGDAKIKQLQELVVSSKLSITVVPPITKLIINPVQAKLTLKPSRP